MGTAGSVCAQPPAARGLLDQFLAGVRFFGEPEFWQVSDNVNPGSVNPGNGELQKLKQQIYTKKNCNPHKNTLRNTSPFLNSSLITGRVLGKREPLLPARNDDPS